MSRHGLVTSRHGPTRVLRHDAALSIVLLLMAVVGHGAATSVLETLEHQERSLWTSAAWVLAFVLATLLFYRLYANPLPSKLPPWERHRVRRRGFLPWLAGVWAVLSLYGFATGIHQLMNGGHFPRWLFAVYASAVVLLFAIAYRFRSQVLTVHLAREQEMGAWAKRCHLILVLSEVNERYRDTKWHPPGVEWSVPADLDVDLQALVIAKNREEKGVREQHWPWEMPLRAVREHCGVVKELTLICSPESIRQAWSFRDRVKLYTPFRDLEIRVWAERDGTLSMVEATMEALEGWQGVDFSRINDLSASMTDLVNHLLLTGVPSREIMIDFTGGKKPVSFVAAAATLRGSIAAQYVDTTPPHTTFIYDLVTNPEPQGA